MNNLTTAAPSTSVSMSSLEIAEITGKDHNHVMRDIRVMLDEIGEGQSKFGSTYADAQGKVRSCYFLPEEEMLTLVSGYRVDLRRAIIARWKALEAGRAEPLAINFADPAVLTGVLDHLQSQVATQKAQLEAQVPKVLAQDRLSRSEGSLSLSDAAKALGIGPRAFNVRLLNMNWLFRRGRHNPLRPYQDKITAGYLEAEPVTGRTGNGVDWTQVHARVTPKGLAKLAETFGKQVWL